MTSILWGQGHRMKMLRPEGDYIPQVLEVWFAGTHCDVGGGNVKDEGNPDKYTPSLANIPLRWMISELYNVDKKVGLNIRWRHEQLPLYGIRLPPFKNADKSGLDPNYEPDDNAKPRPELSRSANFKDVRTILNGVEIDNEFHEADVRQEIQGGMWSWDGIGAILMMLIWWSFEFIPFVMYSRNKVTQEWETTIRWNLFRPREILKDAVPPADEVALPDSDDWAKFFRDNHSKARYHKSVSERIDYKGSYKPAAWNAPWYWPWAWGSTPENWEEWTEEEEPSVKTL